MSDPVTREVVQLRERIDDLEQAGRILEVQQQILELTARGSPREDTLTRLCTAITDLVPGALAWVMEMGSDADGPRLDMVAAHGVAAETRERCSGLRPAPDAGSCGTSAFTGEMVIVSDILRDPRWELHRELAEEFGIRACWSIPILVDGEVVATFAISHRAACVPTRFQEKVLRTACHLAGLAIERQRGQDELERASERVAKLEKFESLGIMAGGIAHDFNNLLTGVIGNAELARRLLADDTDATRRIDAILRAAESCSTLCAQMLTYAGRANLERRTCDLTSVVRNALEVMQTAVHGKATLRVELDAEPVHVRADPDHLGQVVVNLLVNAMDAVDTERGELIVRVGRRRFGAEQLRRSHGEELDPGEHAFLEVSDDGHGIDDEVRARMFDPFFTTRHGGRGLGLASALGIVRAHEGTIDVESVPGEGTNVRVILPCSPDVGASAETPAETATDAMRGTETVLVVDDEALVRDLARVVLEDSGYRVLEAAGGKAALALLESGGIDVILLDLVMPDISGAQVLRHVRQQLGDLPTIVSSGHVHRDLHAQLADDPATSLLPKPYRSRDLLGAVRAAVGLQHADRSKSFE